MATILDKTIAAGLLTLIVFSAFAHGVVEPWSALIFKLALAALVMLWALKAVVERKLTVMIPPVIWPLIGLIILGVVQSVTVTGNLGERQSLSFDAEATRGTVMMLCGLLAGALLAANFLTTPERLRTLAKFMTFFGLALAFFAIIQHFTWQGSFYWLRPSTADTPFGPFGNRNHFAGYLELLLPWPVALMLERKSRRDEMFFYFLAAVWMGAAAIFSLSRGGMISIFAELLLLGVLSARWQSRSPEFSEAPHWGVSGKLVRFGAVATIMLAISGGAFWLGAERVISRVATGQENLQAVPQQPQTFFASRGEIWRDTWNVVRAHPWLGAGLGAFETAYPTYSQETGLGWATAQAHNDYLQALADGGIVAGTLALWFIITLFRTGLRGVRSEDSRKRTAALACLASLFGLLVHSLFDFNLQLPSHALLFLALAAVACQVGQAETLTAAKSRE